MQLPVIATLGLAWASTASAWHHDAVAIIEEIAPGSAECAAGNTECRTARQATPHIFHGMARYGVWHPNQMAAVVALMAFESVDFAYKRNQYPGRPGQGTANMQMAEFNLEYARSIPALSGSVANVTSVDGQSDAELNRILDLVVPDAYCFASGPWFLETQCGGQILAQLVQDIDLGFESYMGCVGVAVTEDRRAYLGRAKQAFGIKDA